MSIHHIYQRTNSGISVFHNAVIGNLEGPRSTVVLVDEAQVHLNNLQQKKDRFVQSQTPYCIDSDIDPHRILQALLDYSDRSGGPDGSDHSRRYIASAIICCEEEVEQQVALANTFVGVFLWPFVSNSHCYQDSPSFQASHNGDTTRKATFQKEVLKRDAYKCIVLQARDHRCRPQEEPLHSSGVLYKVEACHIIKRAVLLTARQTDQSTVVTFDDILRHYCNLTTREISELDAHLDDPSNGLSMSIATLDFFDEFRWCLVPGPQVGCEAVTYRMVEFGGPWIPPSRPSPIITFRDHSTAHINLPDMAKDLVTSNTGYALPNPKFIRIHASIAHVLHMSAAAEVLDSIMGRYKPFGPAVLASKPTASLDTVFAALSLAQN